MPGSYRGHESETYTPTMTNPAPDYRDLSVSERIQPVADIWHNVVAELPDAIRLTPAQRAELDRRLEAHDADPCSALAWDEVRAELVQRNH